MSSPTLKLVIIGAGGLVGSRLAERIVQQQTVQTTDGPAELCRVVLFDARNPRGLAPAVLRDPRTSVVIGDLCDKDTMTRLIQPDGCSHVSIIHLAAVLSGYAEENFDLGMKVNLYGTLNVIECVRALGVTMGAIQKYVYVSTDYVTAFIKQNKENPCNEESFRLSPVSYGCQKACIEILLSDYSRKGFVDGRIARLSAVIGRPGWSNSISYPYTGIFTQPLEGKDYDVPLPMDVPYPCSSLEVDVKGLIKLATDVKGADIGHNRVVQLPASSLTLRKIWAATQEVAKELNISLGKIRQVASSSGTTTVTEINVCPAVSHAKAARLGLDTNVDLNAIIRDYAKRYILPKASQARL